MSPVNEENSNTMKKNQEYRIEKDSMGEITIPADAYWGAQTGRAIENFKISKHRISSSMIKALGLIKKHAALTNAGLSLISQDICDVIVRSADEIIQGKWDDQFPLDVFQTGSGTSWNMNANELIANRANELLGFPRGTRNPVHPNDHVNRSQSSNDVIPSALHIANRLDAPLLIEALDLLVVSFEKKEKEFAQALKLGRTHLQDAVPMTFGQELSAFKTQFLKAKERIVRCLPSLEELALGGTAIGTGLNAHPKYKAAVITGIAEETKISFRPADNTFEAIAARDAQVELMGALNVLASALMKIANDLRLLASGPRGALGEIILPSLQPGSSIMPGKVNPVIPEMLIQVAAHINGKAVSVSIAGQHGPLQLNMMHPLIAFETSESLAILTNALISLRTQCIDGLHIDEERLAFWIEWSLALVTPLALEIGYDRASALAYRAYKEKKKIRDLLEEEKILPKNRIESLLDPKSMI